nr:unnamed protein product [Callosobruchus analis]
MLPARRSQRYLQSKILRQQSFSSVKISKKSSKGSITPERRMSQSNPPCIALVGTHFRLKMYVLYSII